MKAYSIRLYHGYCNSSEGFNDGYYLDDIEILAENEFEAIEKAMTEFKAEHPMIAIYESFDLQDTSIAWICGYYDNDGNPIRSARWPSGFSLSQA